MNLVGYFDNLILRKFAEERDCTPAMAVAGRPSDDAVFNEWGQPKSYNGTTVSLIPNRWLEHSAKFSAILP